MRVCRFLLNSENLEGEIFPDLIVPLFYSCVCVLGCSVASDSRGSQPDILIQDGNDPQTVNMHKEERGPGPSLDDLTLRANLKPRLTGVQSKLCRGSNLTQCQDPSGDALLPSLEQSYCEDRVVPAKAFSRIWLRKALCCVLFSGVCPELHMMGK